MAPLLKIILDLLGFTDLKVYTWVTTTCTYISLVTTLPTAWVVDKWGLKFGIYTALMLTILRNGFGALFCLPDLPFYTSLRYVYFVLSSILNQQVMTLFFCLPLKVSETWFKEKERFTAWAIIMIGFNVGSAVSAALIPIYITDRHNIYLLAYCNIIVALILFLIVSICVRDSKPPTPPSDRMMISSNSTLSYLAGMKTMLSNKDFMVHLFFSTCNDTFALSISPILQDILETAKYDNKFCGQLIAIGSIASAVFLFTSSYSVIIIKTSATGCKILASIAIVALILYFQALQMPNSELLIICSLLFRALLSSATRPCFQNMSAHLCSGFVREATISGFSITLAIFLNSIFSLIVVYMRKKIGSVDYSYQSKL